MKNTMKKVISIIAAFESCGMMMGSLKATGGNKKSEAQINRENKQKLTEDVEFLLSFFQDNKAKTVYRLDEKTNEVYVSLSALGIASKTRVYLTQDGEFQESILEDWLTLRVHSLIIGTYAGRYNNGYVIKITNYDKKFCKLAKHIADETPYGEQLLDEMIKILVRTTKNEVKTKVKELYRKKAEHEKDKERKEKEKQRENRIKEKEKEMEKKKKEREELMKQREKEREEKRKKKNFN